MYTFNKKIKEFLEALGYECVEVGDHGPATPQRDLYRFEKWTRRGCKPVYVDRLEKTVKFFDEIVHFDDIPEV